MILVIDLMRNIFIIMFFVLMALEVIVLISLTVLYKGPVVNNQPNVEAASLQNTKEVLNSFNSILIRKYYNIETDLMLIAKHLYPMYLSQTNTEGNYPKIQKSSPFYKSYKNCMQNYPLVLNQTLFNDTLSFVINKYQNFSTFEDDEIIDSLINEPALNYITYYPENVLQNNNFELLETYVCYAISMFKSLLIRNTIFDKNYPNVNNFIMKIDDNYLFQYPMKKFDINSFPFLNKNCSFSSLQANCISTFRDFASIDYNTKQEIYFDKPTFNNGQILSRSCIYINYLSNENSFACIDFSLNNILRKIKIQTHREHDNNHYVKMFLFSPSTTSFNSTNQSYWLYYTNMIDLNNFNYSIYSSNNFNNFNLSPGSINFQLFHAIYYDIFSYDNSYTTSQLDSILKEYNSILELINSSINNINIYSSTCNDFSQNSQIFSFHKSYLEFSLNNTGSICNILFYL